MKKVGFFEEEEGVKSSTRLNSFILLAFLMLFDYLLSRMPAFKIDYFFIVFNFVMLLGVFAPKYLHKLAENNAFLTMLKAKKEE